MYSLLLKNLCILEIFFFKNISLGRSVYKMRMVIVPGCPMAVGRIRKPSTVDPVDWIS